MKKIAREAILGQITDKFALQEFEREDFLFGEFVVPTYDIGGHVKNWEIVRNRIAVTANGAIALHECPTDKKWRMRRLIMINEAGGNFDIDQIFHYNYAIASTDIDYIFYDTASPIGSGTVKIFEFPQDIPFSYGDKVVSHVANFVAGGWISLHMFREVETVR